MSLPIKTDELHVVSGGASNPRVVAGTADPTSGVSAPEGSVYLRYVASSGQVFVKSGTGDTDWTDLVSVGGSSLDGSYDFGGSGAGRTITVDSGAVQLDAFTANTQAALQINRQPSSSAASVGIDLVLNANLNTSGAGIQISDPGAGNSIKVTKSNAGSAYFADLTNAGAKALEVVVTAAPTSASPVSIVANTTGTTAVLLSISKIPGAATAGNAISVSMGANTTGAGITVSQAGTGAAIEIAAGSLEVANSAAAVSPSNRGRLRYNSGTQTFQVSMNGAAYVDITTGASFTLDIGDTIGGSTVGSVLFVGAGGVLQQDNANLFWNDTTNRLGLGTNTPGAGLGFAADIRVDIAKANHSFIAIQTATAASDAGLFLSTLTSPTDMAMFLDESDSQKLKFALGLVDTDTDRNTNTRLVLHQAGGLEILNSDSATVSASNAGKIRYNTTGQKFQVSANGGAYVDVALNAAAFTTGSVPFANSSGQLAQDNAAFFWDVTNKRLLITQSATDPLDGKGSLTLRNTNATGNASVYFNNAAGSFVGTEGYDNATAQLRTYTGAGIAYSIYTNNGANQWTFSSDGALQATNGGSAAVSAASTGRIRYTTTGQKFQISMNGGAYVDVATQAAAFTQHSVLFANASGQIAQDNATFRWVDATNNLEIGTSAVTNNFTGFPLTVSVSSTDIVTYMWNTNAAGFSAMGVLDNALAFKANWGYGNASTPAPFANKAFFQTAGCDFVLIDSASTYKFFFGMADNFTVMQMANGSSGAVSEANTGRIRYNTTGQKFQVSMNGAAYVDLATGSGSAPTVERLSADGAADPTIDTTFVSGTGTDLTLANGSTDGFIKNFVVTGGSGTITPTNLADGNVLTWTATPANVSLIWDATGTTWHVYGNPYNMVTT